MLFAPVIQRAIAFTFRQGMSRIHLLIGAHIHLRQLNGAHRLILAVHHHKDIARLRNTFAIQIGAGGGLDAIQHQFHQLIRLLFGITKRPTFYIFILFRNGHCFTFID
ncbi:hypothetical protein D3C75_1179460 [compost metagenome]